jgi:hypothetical protein
LGLSPTQMDSPVQLPNSFEPSPSNLPLPDATGLAAKMQALTRARQTMTTATANFFLNFKEFILISFTRGVRGVMTFGE